MAPLVLQRWPRWSADDQRGFLKLMLESGLLAPEQATKELRAFLLAGMRDEEFAKRVKTWSVKDEKLVQEMINVLGGTENR